MRVVLRLPVRKTKLLDSSRISSQWLQTRGLTATAKRSKDQGPDATSQGLQGYYADLLDAPLHKIQPAAGTAPEPSPQESLPRTQREETLAKARLVFGSRLSGPEERQKELESRSRMIAGVLVPPRPEEPDNCCMSGCVNCVWELYREEMEEYLAKKKEADHKMMELRTAGKVTGMMASTEGTPSHVAISMDDDGGGSETNWDPAAMMSSQAEGTKKEDDDPLAGIPVGIREFMKTEKRLKAKHKAAGEYVESALDKDLRASVWGHG